MIHEPEFDRLRQACLTALQQFLAVAHKTELQMQELNMPISWEAIHQFSSQRSAEIDAYDNYTLASIHLLDFLQRRSYIVH